MKLEKYYEKENGTSTFKNARKNLNFLEINEKYLNFLRTRKVIKIFRNLKINTFIFSGN